MARPKKVVDFSESTTVKPKEKEIANPCDSCPKTYDKKSSFCKTCVNYRG